MYTRVLLVIVLVTTQFGLFSSCKKTPDPEPLKVGLVAGLSDLDDGGFNEQAIAGLTNVSGTVSVIWEARESHDKEGIEANIHFFAEYGYDVVITLGYDAAQYTLDAAVAYPSVKFMLLDFTFDSLPSNMVCATFRVDQASFPCGFLAAYWAWKQKPAGAAVGYVAGPDIPTIRQFTTSFTKGVEYFTTQYDIPVSVSGYNCVSFSDTLEGARAADSLIQQGAEVIFACAGQSGNGALYKVKELSKTGIGVDSDQYYSLPQVGHYLITSCMKNLDAVIVAEITDITEDKFHGGQTLVTDLVGSGVGLAPYHDYDTLIPDTIKQAVISIKSAIIAGTLSTGWIGK